MLVIIRVTQFENSYSTLKCLELLIDGYVYVALSEVSNWLMMQAFTNCMHGYDRVHNVHTNDVTRAGKFVHGIDSSV